LNNREKLLLGEFADETYIIESPETLSNEKQFYVE